MMEDLKAQEPLLEEWHRQLRHDVAKCINDVELATGHTIQKQFHGDLDMLIVAVVSQYLADHSIPSSPINIQIARTNEAQELQAKLDRASEHLASAETSLASFAEEAKKLWSILRPEGV